MELVSRVKELQCKCNEAVALKELATKISESRLFWVLMRFRT